MIARTSPADPSDSSAGSPSFLTSYEEGVPMVAPIELRSVKHVLQTDKGPGACRQRKPPKPLIAGARLGVAAVAAMILVLLGFSAKTLIAAEPSRTKRIATDEAFKSNILPIIQKHCVRCHGEDDPEGDISFHDLRSPEQVLENRKTWEKAFKQLGIGGMPPKRSRRRPTPDEQKALIEWLDLKLHHVDCDVVDDVGRVTIHRLNRTEYNNTVGDLLGVDLRPADDFPSDDVGYGFNNIGDVLSLPPLLFEKYVDASERIASAVIWTQPPGGRKQRFLGNQLKAIGGVNEGERGAWMMYSAGSVYREQDIAVAGEYLIRVEAAADQAGPELAKMEIRVDNKAVEVHDFRGHRKLGTYEVRRRLSGGRRRIEAAFVNDYYNPKAENAADRDRNLSVRSIEIQGPIGTEAPQLHKRIVFTRPSEKKTVEQAAREIFHRLLPRAFRRPVDDVEVDRISKLVRLAVERGDSFERGIQVGLQAVLISPHFLFRIEYDPQPGNPKAQHKVSDYELASRLSYFLWSTMPDDELFRLAKEKKLHQAEVLDRQIARMLKDPKADALVENFASQWLNLGNLAEVKPDPKLFPEFTPELRADMVRETQMFVRTLFREDRSLLDFLDADFTLVNQRLAKHYGFSGVEGEKFRRVSLPGGQRAGVLTHGSILTLTSNPNRTSLVRRGKWILDNVLGMHLPEPPANIPSLEEGAKESGVSSLREQLKLHREKPVCSACHDILDPLGFGFENFDAIGRWRETSEGTPVDSKGTLPGGESFNGPVALVQILKKREQDFAELVTRKMLTYALGRGLEVPDSCTVDDIVADLKENDYRFSVLVSGIVHSKPFRMRRGEGAKK